MTILLLMACGALMNLSMIALTAEKVTIDDLVMSIIGAVLAPIVALCYFADRLDVVLWRK